MENNKYYTPIIKEFHYGFEFEANYTKEGWQKEMFGIGEKSITGIPQLLVSFLANKGLEGNIRVKYLDREDIESLEFSKIPYVNDYKKKISKNKHVLIRLYSNHIYNLVRVWDVSVLDSDKELKAEVFRGAIKNKSELKRLMQQLNILE